MDSDKTGKFIAELRKAKGMTQQELADMLNLSNKTVSKWETGSGSPDISNLPILADILGITVDELLRGETSDPVDTVDAVKNQHDNNEKKKKEKAIIAAAAAIGAVMGIIAYNFGWLG